MKAPLRPFLVVEATAELFRHSEQVLAGGEVGNAGRRGGADEAGKGGVVDMKQQW